MKEEGGVELCEVGPRDGFQFETTPIPLAVKLEVIRTLMAAGIPRIQATSFVHPRKVPQMADAEALLAQLLPEAEAAGTVLSALALNEKGVERAIHSGVRTVDLSIALNEEHARANANATVQEGVEAAHRMIRAARQSGLQVQLGFQTVWGYAQPDDTPLEFIVDLAQRFADSGLESLSLADSTGMAAPPSLIRIVDAVREAAPGVPLVLHLHDTRGLGLVNIAAALEAGIRRFDTSLGGLGGCPFIPGATGNVATEDVAYLAHRLGFETGVDFTRVAQASRMMSTHLSRRLSGRMYGLLAPQRPVAR